MHLLLPLLVEPAVICEKLQITPTTLRRWEAKEVIPFHPVGKGKRYLEREVETALRKHRFGPALCPDLPMDLRQRVRPEVILTWLNWSRKTLKRRLEDGKVPYYKMGQTYRFAPDEVLYSLGIPAASSPWPLTSSSGSAVHAGGRP